MYGSGPGDDDVIGMGSDRPRRTPRRIGRRARIAVAVVAGGALVAVVAVFAVSRVDARTPAQQALQQLVTEVTTVPVDEQVPGPTGTYAGAAIAGGNPDTQSPPYFSGEASFAGAASFARSGSPSGLGSTVVIDPESGQMLQLSGPVAVPGAPLTAHGHPELLYVAPADCSYCAAGNWALIVALSRFGTFSGLSTSLSPPVDNLGRIDSWTFSGASYASRYLTFAPAGPQRLTPAERAAFTRFDPPRLTPFLDFGGRAIQIGTGTFAELLVNRTWTQLAADLRRPASAPGAAILAEANTLTAQLCRLTSDRPAAACTG